MGAKEQLNSKYQSHMKIFTDGSVLDSLESGAGLIPDVKCKVFLLREGFIHSHI